MAARARRGAAVASNSHRSPQILLVVAKRCGVAIIRWAAAAGGTAAGAAARSSGRRPNIPLRSSSCIALEKHDDFDAAVGDVNGGVPSLWGRGGGERTPRALLLLRRAVDVVERVGGRPFARLPQQRCILEGEVRLEQRAVPHRARPLQGPRKAVVAAAAGGGASGVATTTSRSYPSIGVAVAVGGKEARESADSTGALPRLREECLRGWAAGRRRTAVRSRGRGRRWRRFGLLLFCPGKKVGSRLEGMLRKRALGV